MEDKIVVSVGPSQNLLSYNWVIVDIIKHIQGLTDQFEFREFRRFSDIDTASDIVIYSKQLPDIGTLKSLNAKQVWVPIDLPIKYLNSALDLWCHKPTIDQFDAILTHNTNLIPLLGNRPQTYNIDHYAKYPIDWLGNLSSGKFVWIGVLEYLPETVAYFRQAGINVERLHLLTNVSDYPSQPEHLKSAIQQLGEVSFNKGTITIDDMTFHQWTEAQQAQSLANCSAVIDIKTPTFRNTVKPPTKCQLYAFNGIPVLVNPSHPAQSQLAPLGIELLPLDSIHHLDTATLKANSVKNRAIATELYGLDKVANDYIRYLLAIYHANSNGKQAPSMFSYHYRNMIWKLKNIWTNRR